MSPRGSSITTSPQRNAPYARRPAGQPKSSRQQFSACGACRMRRCVTLSFPGPGPTETCSFSVRCDLKDLPVGAAGPHPACSNCKERNINCVWVAIKISVVKIVWFILTVMSLLMLKPLNCFAGVDVCSRSSMSYICTFCDIQWLSYLKANVWQNRRGQLDRAKHTLTPDGQHPYPSFRLFQFAILALVRCST